jgi:hypothetical protein
MLLGGLTALAGAATGSALTSADASRGTLAGARANAPSVEGSSAGFSVERLSLGALSTCSTATLGASGTLSGLSVEEGAGAAARAPSAGAALGAGAQTLRKPRRGGVTSERSSKKGTRAALDM